MPTWDQSPERLELTFVQGDPAIIDIEWPTLDLAGYVFATQVRRTPESEAATDGAVSIVDEGPPGIIQVSFEADDTAALEAGQHHWDLQWTDPSGNVRTVFAGPVTVLGQVTR